MDVELRTVSIKDRLRIVFKDEMRTLNTMQDA